MFRIRHKLLNILSFFVTPLVNENGKGGGGGGTSTTVTQPWAGQQPYLSDVMEQAKRTYQGGYYKTVPLAQAEFTPEQIAARQRLSTSPFRGMLGPILSAPPPTKQVWVETPGGPMEYYSGQAIAGFTPEQIAAQKLATTRAGQLTPVFESTAQLATTTPEYLQRTLEGTYLTPESNPYLKTYVQRAFEETLPQLDTSAIQAGRYGSGAWGTMKGRTMADVVSGIYGPAYEAERTRQAAAEQFAPQLKLQAAGIAPELAKQDIGMLATVGAEKQAMEQALLDEARKKFEFEQLEPWRRLAMYSGLISGDVGGTTVATQTGGGK